MEKYERIKYYGNGTFSKVYLVKNRQTKMKYIIKCIDIENLDKKEKMLLSTEIYNIQNLDHPFIVHFVETFEEESRRYIVMEYCNRGDLNKSIRRYKDRSLRYDEKNIVESLYQIFMATAYIHSNNVIHRDIKPENIFLHQEVEKIVCKIGDFGLSRVLDKDRQYAMTFVGSPLYMAPELVKGKQYTNKVDVWSIGCIIYELCTFDPLFYDPCLYNILGNIQEMEIPDLPFRFSDELKTLFRCLLERDPDKRLSCAECLESPIFNIPELNRLKVSSNVRTMMRNHSVSQPFCDIQRNKFSEISVKDDINISNGSKYKIDLSFDDKRSTNESSGINNSIRSIDQIQINTSTNQKSKLNDNKIEPFVKFEACDKVDCNRTLDDSTTTFLPRKPVTFQKVQAYIHDETANRSVFELSGEKADELNEDNIIGENQDDDLTSNTYVTNVYYFKDNSFRNNESTEESNSASDDQVDVDLNCYKLKKFLNNNEPDGIINLSKKTGRSYNYKATNYSFNMDNPKSSKKISHQNECRDPYKKQLILAKDNKADISEIISESNHRAICKRSLSANNSLQNLLLDANGLSTSTSFFDKPHNAVGDDILPGNTVLPSDNVGSKKKILKKKIVHLDEKKKAKILRKPSLINKTKGIVRKDSTKLNTTMKQNINELKAKKKYKVENVNKVVVGHNNINCSGHSLSQTRNLNNKISITNHTFIGATGTACIKKIESRAGDKRPNKPSHLTPCKPSRSNSCDANNNTLIIDSTNKAVIAGQYSNMLPTNNPVYNQPRNPSIEITRNIRKIPQDLTRNNVGSINELTKSTRLESSTHKKKSGLSHHPSINLDNKSKYQLNYSTSSIGQARQKDPESKIRNKAVPQYNNPPKNTSVANKLCRGRKSNAEKKHNETVKTYYPAKGMSIEYNMLINCLKSNDYVGMLKFLSTRESWLPSFEELDLSNHRLHLQKYNALIKNTIQFLGFSINTTSGLSISMTEETVHQALFKIKQWISDIRYYRLISSLLSSLISFPSFQETANQLYQAVTCVINKFCCTKKLSIECLDEKKYWVEICEKSMGIPTSDDLQ